MTNPGLKKTNKTVCPHCEADTITIKTVQETPMYRKVVYACKNTDCAHIFEAEIVPTKTLSPSMKPNPAINLPSIA